MSINKKFFVGAFVAAFAFAVASANAAYMHTVTLKQGSTGSQVMSLQQTLNMTSCKVAVSGAGAPGMESTAFGPKTKVAVQCFQASNGLTADGVVGPMTGATLAAVTGGNTGGNYPAGCTSSVGYSSTTGQPCNGSGSSNNGGNTGGLSGGAADIDVTKTSTNTEDNVREGEEDVAVAGFEVEPDGGDVSLSSVRVTFKKTVANSDSDRLDKYVDEVSIWHGDTKVGSADADDFSRDTSTDPDTYSETIQLSGAVVREDDNDKFYVAVTAVDTIDEDEQDADFNVDVESVRFSDSTGAILNDSVTYSPESFGFEDSSEGDDLELKSSSENPDDETVKVDEDNSTDDILALVAKLDNDEDSSDATILDIPLLITLDNYGSAASTVDDVIDEVIIEIDGEKYEADLSNTNSNDASASDDDLDDDGTTAVIATYNLDLDDGDVVLNAGDDAEIKVWISFNSQDDNYANNTLITASINNSTIDAENEDGDEIDVEGANREGADLTLNIAAATVSGYSWEKSQASNASTGTLDFFFTVEAEDEDYNVMAAQVIDTASAGFTNAGTFATSSGEGTLTRVSGDSVVAISTTGYTVSEGDTVRFRVRYSATSAGNYEATITSVAGQEVPDDDQLSPSLSL